MVIIRAVHGRQVESEVANLPEELCILFGQLTCHLIERFFGELEVTTHGFG